MSKRIVYNVEMRSTRFEQGARRVRRQLTSMEAATVRARRAMRHFRAGNFSQGFTYLGQSVGRATAQLRQFGATGLRVFRGVTGAIGNLLGFVRRLVRRLTIMGGILAGIGVASIYKAAGFGHTVASIGAIGGGSAEQVAQARAGILRTGIKYPYTVDDIAGGALELTRSGLAGNAETFSPGKLGALTRASAGLGTVAGTDFGTAADAIQSALLQLLAPAERAEGVASMLGQTLKTTALRGDELFDVLKGLDIARTAGISLDEYLAVAGQLRGGITAPEVGTVMRRMVGMISALQTKSPKQLAKYLSAEGEEFTPEEAQQIALIGGEASSLVDVMAKLEEKFRGNEAMLIKIFGLRTMQGATRLVSIIRDGGVAAFRDLQEKIRDSGAYLETVNRMLTTTDSKLKRVKAAAGVLVVSVGDKLISAFDVDDKLDGMVGALGRVEEIIRNLKDADIRAFFASIPASLEGAFLATLDLIVSLLGHFAPLAGELLAKGLIVGAKGYIRATAADVSLFAMNPLVNAIWGDDIRGGASGGESFKAGAAGDFQRYWHALKETPAGTRASEAVGNASARVVNNGIVNNYGAASRDAGYQPSRSPGVVRAGQGAF